MWNRSRRKAARSGSLALGALACACACASPNAAATAPAVVPACANDRLPAELTGGDAAAAGSATPLELIDVAAPRARLRLAVAANEVDRELGLMCVLHLRAHDGMIFVFAGEHAQEFWMKNTLVPLDMIWVRRSGVVTTVARNVPAATRTTPEGKLPRRRGFGAFVIELAAGDAARDGIVVGTHLALPALDVTD